MNHKLWHAVGVRVVALSFVIAGAVACGERGNGAATSEAPSTASPSAVVIGQPPAEPQGDTPETTPSSASQSQLSKREEVSGMPNEGDSNSYSTLAKDTPQKAEGVDAQQLPEGSAK